MEEVKKTLSEKRIVLTRAAEQVEELAGVLERMGAEVVRMPTVGFAAPADWSDVDNALRDLARFAWVLFTSQNAIRFLAGRAHVIGAGSELFQGTHPQIAMIGRATAEAAAAESVRVDFVAQQQSGDGLARELRGSIGSGEALLPRSDRADDRLPGALRSTGTRVTEVIAYRTAAPKLDEEILARIRRAEVDAIVFASPSAFQNLAEAMGDGEMTRLSARVQFAAIGPTTAHALREAGARVEIESNEPSIAGIGDALAKYYRRHLAGARQT